MKVLITHINPHLDDIFGIWLLKKYDPQYKDASVEFISAARDVAKNKENQDKVFVGTGGGQFDEHKEGLKTCAGSLVYDFLKGGDLLPQDELMVKALEEMTQWNKNIDMGLSTISDLEEFSPQAFLRSKSIKKEDSTESVELGIKILDRVLQVLKRKQQSLKDWEDRLEFESRFGKTIAVKSEVIDRPFCKRKGGELFILYHPKYKGVQFFTPSQTLDLTPIYEKVKSLDPQASWFLHQSHHMVLCGSSSAPDAKPTKLSFEQLIELVKGL